MFKLLKGEFFKFYKGVTSKIVAVLMVLAIVLTIVIYDTGATFFDGFDWAADMDVFAVIDGIDGLGDEWLDLAGEFGVDLPSGLMGLLGGQQVLNFLARSPKEHYITINPARHFRVIDENGQPKNRLSQPRDVYFRVLDDDGNILLDSNYNPVLVRGLGLHDAQGNELTELINYIEQDRQFLNLLINIEQLTSMIAGGGAANFAAALNELLERNIYLFNIAVGIFNLYDVLGNSPFFVNLNSTFYDLVAASGDYDDEHFIFNGADVRQFTLLDFLRNRQGLNDPSSGEDAIYTIFEFYFEWFEAVFNILSESTQNGALNAVTAVFDAFSHTTLYQKYNVELIDLVAAQDIMSLAVLVADLYDTGLAQALFSDDDRIDVEFFVILATSSQDLAEMHELLQAFAQRNGFSPPPKEAQGEAREEYMLRIVFWYLDTFTNKSFYNYVSALPLFNRTTLARLVGRGTNLYRQINENRFEILEVFVEMMGFVAADVASFATDIFAVVENVEDIQNMTPDETSALLAVFDDIPDSLEFIVYFAITGFLHDAIYGWFVSDMTSLRDDMMLTLRVLAFFRDNVEREGGAPSAVEFVLEELILGDNGVGAAFENLHNLARIEYRFRGAPQAEQYEYLEELLGALDAFVMRYRLINQVFAPGFFRVGFVYFPSGGLMDTAENLDIFRRQFNAFNRYFNRLSAQLENPMTTLLGRISLVVQFTTNVREIPRHGTAGLTGFFGNTAEGVPMQERMEPFLEVLFGIDDAGRAEMERFRAPVTSQFFDATFAPLFPHIEQAFISYFRVFKDNVFEWGDGAVNKYFLPGYMPLGEGSNNSAIEYLAFLIAGQDGMAKLTATFKDAFNDNINSYEAFRYQARTFTRVATIVTDLVPKAYVLHVTDVNNISDRELSRVSGFINIMGFGLSKYSIQSDITQHMFFLRDENIELFGTLANPMGLDGGFGFMAFSLEILMLFILLAIAVVASGSIAGEYEVGSIKLLLIRPYKRWKVLSAKILFIVLLVVLLYLFSYLLLLFFGHALVFPLRDMTWQGMWQGLSDLRSVFVVFDARHASVLSQLSVITLQYAASMVHMLMYAIIAVMVSTVFRSRAAAVAVSIFVYFAGTILSLFLSTFHWYRYIIFNNTFWFMYMSSGPSLGGMTLGFSIAMYFAYLAVILAAAYVVFEKRDAV